MIFKSVFQKLNALAEEIPRSCILPHKALHCVVPVIPENSDVYEDLNLANYFNSFYIYR